MKSLSRFTRGPTGRATPLFEQIGRADGKRFVEALQRLNREVRAAAVLNVGPRLQPGQPGRCGARPRAGRSRRQRRDDAQ